MGAPETADELRARLSALYEKANDREDAGTSRAAARRQLSFKMYQAWPAIDALLARLTTAEARTAAWKADADKMRPLIRHQVGCVYLISTRPCDCGYEEARAFDALVAEDTDEEGGT